MERLKELYQAQEETSLRLLHAKTPKEWNYYAEQMMELREEISRIKTDAAKA